MLITSIYCAHNMGAHCACCSCSPLVLRLKLFLVLVVYTCRLRLLRLRATHASLDTLLLLLAPLRLVFPLPFFRFLSFARPFFLFLLLLHSKFNYRECEFLLDSESDSASHVLFQHRRLSANFQRISILFAVDLCNARPFEAHALPSARPP